MSALSNLLSVLRKNSVRKSRAGCSRPFSLSFEVLEDRRVMSSAPASLYYTAIAQMFPRHEGPTGLYLNFDGWLSEEVAGFNPTTPDDGNAATDERERDIQDIIFRVSEMFSPF